MSGSTSPPLRRAVAVGLGLVLGLALGEIALRLLDRPREQPVGWAWRGDPAESNELGFRGHRQAGHIDDTIMLVGDSQVEADTPFAEMPEVFLQQALRAVTGRDIRVVTVGSYGWGQDQQLLVLRRTIGAIRPRLVVVWFTPVNDLWNNTFPTHLPRDGWAKPTFWLEKGALRGPHAAWGTPYHPPGLRLLRALRPLTGRPPFVTDAEWEPKLPPAYRDHPEERARARSMIDYAASYFEISREQAAQGLTLENFANEKAHASIGLTPRSPRLDYSIRLTRALFAEIAELCRRHGAQFVIFYVDTGPFDGVLDDPTPFEVGGRVVLLSNASARAVIDDVLAGFPALALTGYHRGFRMSNVNTHLNAEGHRYFMTELAGRLAVSLRP